MKHYGVSGVRTVLVIDDDAAFRKTARRWLLGVGYQVLEASDGEGGVAVALKHQPDAIVCDLLMPRFNGFQVCRMIRSQRDKIKQPLIIATTGSGYATDKQNAIESGADGCLLKPFTQAELLRLLESTGFLQPSATTRRPPMPPPPSTLMTDQPPYVKFWGVRGSIPTPGPSTVKFGGNTSCVEVRADGEIIVLDAGSGIRGLGLALAAEFKSQPIGITVLISHTHWDHIQGFPFFVPAYNPMNKLRILGYEGARKELQATLTNQMESPYFPISMRAMPGNIDVKELKELDFSIGKVKVRAVFLNHPGVCVGYRLFTSGGSVVYMPDHEPFQRMRSAPATGRDTERRETLKYASDQDQKIIEFVKDADVLIIDSQYDDAEYQTHVGWGHGCVDDVVVLAMFAKVKQLFLFHHDPDHTDAQIAKMESWAKQLVQFHGETLKVDAACEGVQYVLKPDTAAVSPSP